MLSFLAINRFRLINAENHWSTFSIVEFSFSNENEIVSKKKQSMKCFKLAQNVRVISINIELI